MSTNVEQQQTCLSGRLWIVNVRHEGVTAMIASTELFSKSLGGTSAVGPAQGVSFA